MLEIHHLNCVDIDAPTGDHAIGHCVVLKVNESLVLIDSGIGVVDCLSPELRLGKELIEMVGFNLHVEDTVYKQLKRLGLDPNCVTDIVVSHLDCDHIGGASDFPKARLHVGLEEYHNYLSDNPRYLRNLLDHKPVVKLYESASEQLFGLEVRKVDIEGDLKVYLTPLFGHTLGHCGVLYQVANQWYFYIGDAYYLKAELFDDNHSVSQLTQARADDNDLRLKSMDIIKGFMKEYPDVKVYSYHDLEEYNSVV
ncbi:MULTISPECIES: MBL fold metallo-hydrolase [Myroides]|uniref:MBL fold metallo-hydrolase n=1 Tax=Myroides albus TaxID=2562892 RepID=A0A6I3LTK3_9FLAO|nr:MULTISPECIES: MBL fold metallo-hydrolase [Myroides]MTG99305.1 MBL fold metallo-hydrolase [Myroides albus]MVX36734.1 MBL fold metallo-hydrolase [Myroides sp. LoEW2-1]UVD79992.1 MBL fold metallo-hydrolase [Myroides albus]